VPEASPESIDATLAAAEIAWGRAVELVDDLSFSTRATVLRIAADGRTAVAVGNCRAAGVPRARRCRHTCEVLHAASPTTAEASEHRAITGCHAP